MLFKEIIGQNVAKQKFIQTVKDGRISHAQLLLGPEGSGSLALAMAYAQYISCESRNEDDSCGKCASCHKYQKLIHPDLHFVFPVATTAKISKNPVSDDFIKEWRTAILQNPYLKLNEWLNAIGVENKQASIYKNESNEIIKKLSLKTFEAEYKIVIIWMPEKMNITAANKLLKIIEEPPPKTLFLLVSENTEQIIPTILSRIQLVKIPKINSESLFESIKLKYDFNDQKIWDIIRLSNGNYAKVLEILNSSEENSYNLKMFISLMRLCYKKEVLEIIKWVDQIALIGREKQKIFIEFSLRLLRENFILNIENKEIVYLTQKESEFSSKFSQFINEKNIYMINNEFNKAHYHIRRNAYNKIVFLDLSLKLIRLLKM
ncbi:MAG: DNA polymerase III subunit delta [Bacteroidales bacterium]|nr:DNA polymerase III subunit delta [Bacteroidales bacterium]